MSARTDLLNTNYNERLANLLEQRRDLERTYGLFLKDLTKDELYDLAAECGAEEGADHCWRCKAWAMYLKVAE